MLPQPLTSPPPDVPRGRPRTPENRDLLPGIKRRPGKQGDSYYFVHDSGYQEPLGKDYDEVIRRYPALRAAAKAGLQGEGFSAVADAFEIEYLPGLAKKTANEYTNGLAVLRKVFGSAPLETILPGAVGALKRELRATPTAFNRLKALLSVLWNWSREGGLTAAPNPCTGVKGYHEHARDVVVTDRMYFAVYDQAEQMVKDWMDMTVTSGPRVSDVLKILRPTAETLNAGELHVFHGKRTRKVVRVDYEDDLREVVESILARTAGVRSVYLIHDERGQPYSYAQLKDRFDAARAAARAKAEEEGVAWVDYQRRDLRAKSATDAKTLGEAQDRLAHADPRTTQKHYRRVLRARPGRLPTR